MLAAAIATEDATSSAQLRSILEQTNCVKAIKIWTIRRDKAPNLTGTLPDVVFLDLSRDPEPYFAFAAQLRRINPAMKLVACSASSPLIPQLLLEAMRSGVHDFLPKPVQMSALQKTLSRFVPEIGRSESSSAEKFVAVMGTKGGVGATTVTVNLGVQLSCFARKRVILLDLARPLGNVHLLLDLYPSFGIRDAVTNLERLDSRFFAGLLTRHKTNLEILGGAMQPEEWDTIPVSRLDRIVSVAQNSFDFVVADIGSQFSSECGPLLQTAAMIFVVVEANLPALWALDRHLRALRCLGIKPERIRIIMNRWHKGDEKTLQTIQKDLVYTCLPNDFRKASATVIQPLVNSRDDVFTNSFRQLAADVAGIEAISTPKWSFLHGFFSSSRDNRLARRRTPVRTSAS
jgi:pilus assembly protein CpaE